MKVTLVACAWVALLLGGRPATAAEVTMGPALGFTHTKLTGTEVDSGSEVEESGMTGFSLRYRVMVGLKPRLAVETGLGLLRQGAEITYTDPDPDQATFQTTQTGEYTFTTLEVPVRLRFRVTPPASGVGVHAIAGMALGIRAGAEYEYANVELNTATGVSTLSLETDSLDNASSVVTSATFGLEVDREVRTFLVSLGVVYHLGFGDSVVATEPTYQGYSVVAGKTAGWEIALGVSARL